MAKFSKILDFLRPSRGVKRALEEVKEQNKNIMATQQEAAAELRAMKTQVIKIGNEQGARFDTLTAKISDLERIIQQGEASQELTDAVAEVKTALQALDDTIPDPVPPES